MVNPHGVVDGLRLTRDRAELMTDGAIRCGLLLPSFPGAIHASPLHAACLEAGRPGLDLSPFCALFPRPERPRRIGRLTGQLTELNYCYAELQPERIGSQPAASSPRASPPGVCRFWLP